MLSRRCPFLARSLHTKTEFITKVRPKASQLEDETSKSEFITKVRPKGKVEVPVEQDLNLEVPKSHQFRSQHLMNHRMTEFNKDPKLIYHFTDTLSIVKPYSVDVGIHLTREMRKQTLREVLETRHWPVYAGRKKQHIIDCIRSGKILVDGIKVLPDTKLKGYDKITINEHRHEDAIPNTQLKQKKLNIGTYIVDKPPGIPTIPDSNHFFNTMQLVLYTEHNLDRLNMFNNIGKCSGVIILTVDHGKCVRMLRQQLNGEITFTYVTRVYGKFPEDQTMLETTYEKFPFTQAKVKHCGYDLSTDSTLLEIEVQNVRQDNLQRTLAEFEHPVRNDWGNAGALRPFLDDTLGVKFGDSYTSLLDGCKSVTEKRELSKRVAVLSKLKKERVAKEWIVNVKSLNLNKELKEFYNQYLKAVKEEVREAQCLRCGVVRLPLPPDINNPSLHLKSINTSAGLIESEQILPWFA